MLHIGFGSFFRGNIGRNIRLRRRNGGLLARHLGFLRHVLYRGHQLAPFHVVTLLHIEVGDAAHRGGAEIHITSLA